MRRDRLNGKQQDVIVKKNDLSIFGSELFTSSSMVFEPNLRIPTPAGYILGPDDELTINVFGFSETSLSNIMEGYQDSKVFIPNAFSPNGDGVNDFFRVPALNKNKLVRLTLYNRWGQVYFQTKDVALGWNGRFKHQEAEGGVYIYYLEMTGLSGISICCPVSSITR